MLTDMSGASRSLSNPIGHSLRRRRWTVRYVGLWSVRCSSVNVQTGGAFGDETVLVVDRHPADAQEGSDGAVR
jgi:hypothetical protein